MTTDVLGRMDEWGPTVTVAEIARLARTMTWRWAVVDMFHGGAKAGIPWGSRA